MVSCFSAQLSNCYVRKSQVDCACASPRNRAGLRSPCQSPCGCFVFRGVQHAHTADGMLNTDYCFLGRLDIGCRSPRMHCFAEPGEVLGSSADQSTDYCLLNENTEQARFASGMYRSEYLDRSDTSSTTLHIMLCNQLLMVSIQRSLAKKIGSLMFSIKKRIFINGNGRQAYNCYQHSLICICTNIPNQDETAGSVLAQ